MAYMAASHNVLDEAPKTGFKGLESEGLGVQGFRAIRCPSCVLPVEVLHPGSQNVALLEGGFRIYRVYRFGFRVYRGTSEVCAVER